MAEIAVAGGGRRVGMEESAREKGKSVELNMEEGGRLS